MSDKTLRALERAWIASGRYQDWAAFQRERVRHGGEELLMVYRTPYENPSCKRVTRFVGFGCPLEWFRCQWAEALTWEGSAEDENHRKGISLTAGKVEGLSGLFGRIAEEQAPPPGSWEELDRGLPNLWYFGRPRVEAPVVSALLDDDDLELAVYMLPLSYALSRASRSAFMLHEDWRLPTTAAGEGSFEPELRSLPGIEPQGAGSGAIYVVDMSIRVSTNLSLEARNAVSRLSGVRVPGLPAFLNSVEPSMWPRALIALKAALGSGETSLEGAVKRCVDHGLEEIDVLSLAAEFPSEEDWGVDRDTLQKSRSACSSHLVQVSRWDGWIFDQWLLFDDLWATANADLAQSLLWYASDWNPFRGEDSLH